MKKKEKIKLISDYRDILNAVRRLQTGDKSALANAAGVSWPTLSKAIEKLEEKGAICREACDGGHIYAINGEFAYFAGIYIANNSVKVSICNFLFQSLSWRDLEKNHFTRLLKEFSCEQGNADRSVFIYELPNEKDSTDMRLSIIDRVNKVIDAFIQETSVGFHLLGVTVVFPGTIDYELRKFDFSPNLRVMEGSYLDTLVIPSLKEKLEKRGIFLYYDNDSETAVLFEKEVLYDIGNKNYALRNKQNVGCIYIGVGIGLGLILNNMLIRGGTGSAGEIGHIPAPTIHVTPQTDAEEKDKELYERENGEKEENKKAALCTCGQVNCLEKNLKYDVFNANEMEDYLEKTTRENLWEFKLTHPYRYKILEGYISCILNILISLYNFDIIIFTGRIINQIEAMSDSLALLRPTCVLKTPAAACKFNISNNENAVLSGAAMAAYHKCGMEDSKDPIQVTWLDTCEEKIT